MKSLLDIQQDIRDLEADMKEITGRIRAISSDINDIRNTDSDMEFDYGKIEILAEKIPFESHPLDGLEDGRACLLYLEMLLNIVRMDQETNEIINRLILIQWMLVQSRINRSLEELVKDTWRRQSDLFEEFVRTLPKTYVDGFMLDALIVANMGGAANREILEYLAELSSLLGIDAGRLRTLAQVARVVLCRKFCKMERTELEEVLKYAVEFDFYFNADMIEKAVQNQREIVFKLDKKLNIRWMVKQKQKVKKGDIVASFTEKTSLQTVRTKKIKAPSSGTIFQCSQNGRNYGVISVETDETVSIKAWIKNGGY